MKYYLLIILMSVSLIANADESIAKYLQDISVTVKSVNSEGSGVIFTRKDADGKLINIIWTAGHVISNLKTTREVISNDGTKRTVVEFQDAKIVKEIVEDGRSIGRLELDAEVLKYSDADTGHDLAILRVRKKDFVTVSVRFYNENKIPELATPLYHCASLLGSFNAHSITTGVYSQVGRLINKMTFDSTTCVAMPGSSGAGIFLSDGLYVGMLTRGSSDVLNLMVPIRRIKSWAKEVKVEWALDPNIDIPSEEELKKILIEDSGRGFNKNMSIQKEYPTLIRKIANASE